MRTEKIIIGVILFFCFGQTVQAQKVKYKDLFLLLSAKKYDDAGPILKKFLNDPKNTNHANANLQMGMYYQHQLEEEDYLVHHHKVGTYYDSSIFYLNKALTLITEKEVKKRDQYYEDFYRRDLRTGKFGIKLSDVQFDIKKRMETVESKNTIFNNAFLYFSNSEREYKAAWKEYLELVQEYKDEKHLDLLADTTAEMKLNELAVFYDSALVNFEKYKAVVEALPKKPYNQELHPKNLEKFVEYGMDSVSFLVDKVQVWDYKKWASAKIEVLESVKKIKSKLKDYNKEIDAFNRSIDNEKYIEQDLSGLIEDVVVDQLKTIDAQPMPVAYLEHKLALVQHRNFQIAPQYYPDTSNVFMQLEMAEEKFALGTAVDAAGKTLTSFDLEQEYKKYPDFFKEQFSDVAALSAHVKELLDQGIERVAQDRKQLERWETRFNYLTYQQDTLGFAESKQWIFTSDTTKNQYKLLWGQPSKEADAVGYVLGITKLKKQVPALFQSSFDNQFVLDSLALMPLHDMHLQEQDFNKLQVYEVNNDSLNQYYFITVAQDSIVQYNSMLLRAQNGKMIWSKIILTDYKPVGIEVTSEIVIVNALKNENSPENEPVHLVRFDLLGNLKEDN